MQGMTASGAVAAPSTHFDHRLFGPKAGRLGGIADARRQLIVIDVRRPAADIADKEDAIVQASRMGIGEIGVGAFNPHRDIVGDEQIEDAIDAVGGDTTTLGSADSLGNVIGARGFFKGGERGKHGGTHRCPLFAGADEGAFGGDGQRRAGRIAMIMIMSRCHRPHIGVQRRCRKIRAR